MYEAMSEPSAEGAWLVLVSKSLIPSLIIIKAQVARDECVGVTTGFKAIILGTFILGASTIAR
jgi:hypothetical protein